MQLLSNTRLNGVSVSVERLNIVNSVNGNCQSAVRRTAPQRSHTENELNTALMRVKATSEANATNQPIAVHLRILVSTFILPMAGATQ